ncbi:MAG: hypothetical protein COS94_01925 [Candidatus Hydrogenedentes bacterium CG07_land_8_20_14_0_80_42_17]|nr:MAG: hypothetical protein COS94_01925 [Candidatus Hydrogenedentes bacterium CG07_land_8_20_14_0_80_42_17]
MASTWNIRITDRRGRAKVHTLGELPLIFGRDESLPIPIDDPQVSRHHCKIEECDDNSFRVLDMGSTNGTLLNGKKISRAVVGDGDRIKIGETILEFVKVQEVSVDDDTGLRRLSILKSFSSPKKQSVSDQKEDEKAAVLSRIGVSAGQASMTPALSQRLELVARIAHVLTEELTAVSTFELILSELIKVYPIDRAAILRWNEEKKTLEPSVSRIKEGASGGVVVSRTICQHIISTREAIVTENAMVDPRFSSGDSIIENRMGSIVAAPIIAREKFFGVLYACTQETAAAFSEQDLSYLVLIGNLIALAIILFEPRA